jgi:hypothetical protein
MNRKLLKLYLSLLGLAVVFTLTPTYQTQASDEEEDYTYLDDDSGAGYAGNIEDTNDDMDDMNDMNDMEQGDDMEEDSEDFE